MTETATPAEAEPMYLDGAYAPVPDEIDAVDLPVTGALPAELSGRYFRNGPNPVPGDDPGHWFAGHGMVHGVRIADGRAEWYRNRWVRTSLLANADRHAGGARDLAVNPANTHIIEHSGRLLALCEGGLPYELSPELDTVGPVDFRGRLRTAMTAHPKEDPETGELFFFGYGVQPPYVTYHRLSPAGELERSVEIDVPGPTMMHDFAITENYVVWLDLPIVFDFALVSKGMPFQWDDAYGARLGLMRRDGTGPVRWFDIEPCYVFHVGNAREDADGRVLLDGVRYSRRAWDSVWDATGGNTHVNGHELTMAAAESGSSVLYRWTLDPATGRTSEAQLDDRGVEFPTIADARVGRDGRYLYTVGEPEGHDGRGSVVKYDLATGSVAEHDLGTDKLAGEAVFVPAANATHEDDGWLLSVVSDKAGRGSELLVLDAADVAGEPVATITLPRRVPVGFHGSWIADSELA
ncbi:carotenoid oxygenase family protein [Tenggerimyces flavus]|uniref:Dioxygenase n=1 Tax=Tenggerimyces flavus TaxID=1708749 RepID=A0ABV7YBS8_9ACTN|nr:carotenoid oxygenase family protein [Tenggerimyces flavus]MBM7786689.1 carotenoid cleavage dioxygenase [Tenggerimyces flavus]